MTTKTVNLALQGGGAHGAFTWGVLDRLLDEEKLAFEGLSGTSAGAVNAVLLAHGWLEGGRSGAQRALADFWQSSSQAGTVWSPLPTLPQALVPGGEMIAAASYRAFDALSRTFSPYEFNWFNLNPLRDIVAQCVDFDRLSRHGEMKLFISATNVRSGRVRVFDTEELSLDVVMASACLPFLFKAVEIDGEHFWDGGYMGNPSLFPFFYQCDSRDVLIVHINPMERDEVPMSAPDIMNRINEISFNSSLIAELRSINFVSRMIEEGWLKDSHKDRLRNVLVHSVGADDVLSDLSVATKFDVSWNFLTDLRDRGRQAADDWLSENREAIGVRSTADLANRYLRLPGAPGTPAVDGDRMR
ncbi:patatin-like phospholipase family protein [Pseudohoeflea coraliihabitans]|uniref:Patatin-like phospholipase family protein n=1 Tax=Pseudohoeflea coraliihabitans TaxID=2860393 RepID=A0ABS6WMW4_9HYPH|nr:patatin-like phospholipase family protein [Pseudohoeflea sp. DP4N28-3]MBW3096993.1 patatin-like phospholipase family protein [Pseudohoeflea sp. DP4N28-3]